jgi:hypothetical protein
VACALAGCASAPPPVATSEFAVGDSTQGIAERGYRFVPVYQFGVDGHQYAFANAHSGDTAYDLVFIDTKLACSSHAPAEDILTWYWVDEPDGLSYLAGRLRQACGLEAATPPRSIFPVESSSAQAENQPLQNDIHVQGGADEVPRGGTFGRDMKEVAKQGAIVAGTLIVGISALVFAWPVLLAAGVASEAAGSAADAKGQTIEAHAYEFTLPAPAEGVRQALGTPAVQFDLPNVDTDVLGYAVGTDHALYVGVSDGQVVWIHGPDPWLQMLANEAKAQPKRNK